MVDEWAGRIGRKHDFAATAWNQWRLKLDHLGRRGDGNWRWLWHADSEPWGHESPSAFKSIMDKVYGHLADVNEQIVVLYQRPFVEIPWFANIFICGRGH